MKNYTLYIIGIIALLLAGCSGNGEQMRQQLAELEQQNRAGEKMLNDSLAEQLVNYFDRHGSANERMRARYMLGRTYFFLGELPRALETYYTARDCADTTAADCDYKVLSRIHAQSANIYNLQVQPRSQLEELRQAVYYAKRANDTIQAIECYAQQANAYKFLHLTDSVISITETAAKLFSSLGMTARTGQMLGGNITAYVERSDFIQAKRCIDQYELYSGFFDENGNIIKDREIYYYIKGLYYIAVNKLDSAEYLFRKELTIANDLNNQIAGCKGLQEVFTRNGISDSIAKYAAKSYELNDSAYSLSEMQNIQRLKASYDYQHQKQIANEKDQKAERAFWAIALISVLFLLLTLSALCAFSLYKKKNERVVNQYRKDRQNLEIAKAELEEMINSGQRVSDERIAEKDAEISHLQRKIDEAQHINERHLAKLESTIDNHPVVEELNRKVNLNPYEEATSENFQQLNALLNDLIPTFFYTFHQPSQTISPTAYRVCMLTRAHFRSSSISKLTGLSESNIANMKRRILRNVFGKEGSSKDLDSFILNIK